MKNLLALSSLFALAACGLSSSKFDEKFEEKFCSEWEACNSDFSCDSTATGTTTVDLSDCDFDKAKAKSCLDGDWTCDTTNTAFPIVMMPDDCLTVYTCGGTTTGTTTGGTTTGGTTTGGTTTGGTTTGT